MAGVHEDGVTLQTRNLPTDSVSFGRFELEQLPWERRSSFTHNRYLEEAEKYATPGSVSKKKEYFEAHFKKKALLHQASPETQNVLEAIESTCGDDCRHTADFVYQSNMEPVGFSFCDEKTTVVTGQQHEVVEHKKEESSLAELPLEIRSLISKIDEEQANGTCSSDGSSESRYSCKGGQQGDYNACGIVHDLNSNTYQKQIAENRDSSPNVTNCVIPEVSIQLRAQNVSTKTSGAIDQRSGDLKMQGPLPSQKICLKASSSRHSIASGKKTAERFDKKIRPRAKLEKETPLEVSLVLSTESMNMKSITLGNIQAKLVPQHNSEEVPRANAPEVIPHKSVGKSSVVERQSVNRVKLVSKAEIKSTSNVFNFNSSQRAEKRKEFNMKLEKKLHAKEAEMNEMKTRSEVVKHAEIKLLRKSLNFKATPMPSFYHETALRVYEGKKGDAAGAKCSSARSKCPTPARQPCRARPQAASRSNQESSCVTSVAAERKGGAEGKHGALLHSSKKLEDGKGAVRSRHRALQNQGSDGIRREAERRAGRNNSAGSNVKGVVSGRVAVRVAS